MAAVPALAERPFRPPPEAAGRQGGRRALMAGHGDIASTHGRRVLQMSYSMTADGGPDDLPRTLRREREAREREARERLAAERAEAEREALPMGPAPVAAAEEFYAVPDPSYPVAAVDAAMPATVTRFDVPFLHLVGFFLKAALAAIPAILLLGVFIWGAGHLLQTYFPWLVKAQILIHFPN
jgi:hypothetical protein